jgi:hypothetical protein
MLFKTHCTHIKSHAVISRRRYHVSFLLLFINRMSFSSELTLSIFAQFKNKRRISKFLSIKDTINERNLDGLPLIKAYGQVFNALLHNKTSKIYAKKNPFRVLFGKFVRYYLICCYSVLTERFFKRII